MDGWTDQANSRPETEQTQNVISTKLTNLMELIPPAHTKINSFWIKLSFAWNIVIAVMASSTCGQWNSSTTIWIVNRHVTDPNHQHVTSR